ncbi:hypothetical protein ACN38_g12773 [Penicillium nordicum]|uniref:Uncharacterized protein n=1 Tax=Penicillium nordicum TaxID=229535 RepID=A0A0M8NXQ7_9EURO|nr:hypothetical protein ACN38_g12773 [Penicillium nordicum]
MLHTPPRFTSRYNKLPTKQQSHPVISSLLTILPKFQMLRVSLSYIYESAVPGSVLEFWSFAPSAAG